MDLSGVVELRVHGVSGTPPGDLLDCPLTSRLAGDAKAGFYRPRLPNEQHDPKTPDGGLHNPILEGYAWGGLTSGAPSRALWLLLLPFTFINVAPRLRPSEADTWTKTLRAMWFSSRLLAVCMTVLLVIASAGVGLDLFGWQCAAPAPAGAPAGDSTICAHAAPGWLMGPLLGLSTEHRLLVGALVPLLLLTVLGKVSGRTITNYEAVPTSFGVNATIEVGGDEPEPKLDSPWMWHNEEQVRRLRHLHLQAGVAAVLLLLWGSFDRWRIGLGIVAALVTLYVVLMLLDPRFVGRYKQPSFVSINRVVWGVLGIWGAIVAVILGFRHPFPDATFDGVIPGYSAIALTVFLTQSGLLCVFCLLILFMCRKRVNSMDPGAPRGLWGLTGAVLAILGFFLSAVFSAGGYVFAAAWLSTGKLKPGFGEVSRQVASFHFPGVVLDASAAYAVSVGMLFVVLLGIVLAYVGYLLLRTVGVFNWPSAKYQAVLVDDYGPGALEENPARARQIATVIWEARLVDYAQRLVAGLMAIGFVITAFFIYLLMAGRSTSPTKNCFIQWHNYPGSKVLPRPNCPGIDKFWDGYLSARSLDGTGAYLAVLTLFLLVFVGLAAFRVPKTRRSVGILWDLGSFWPRAAHPFAAPCYAERSVPDLTTRVYWYTSSQWIPVRPVVLAAHSQGTVISAATILQLKHHDEQHPETQVLPQIAFLSFGCVLRRLYARYFPAYFSTTTLKDIEGQLTEDGHEARWLNLWRDTDYLGGQVVAGPPPRHPPASEPGTPVELQLDTALEVHLLDPVWDRAPGDTQFPTPGRHSNAWLDPAFGESVVALAEMLVPPPSPDGGEA